MTQVQHSIIIQCSQETVFAFVTDFENDTKWWKPVIRTEKLTDGAINVGTEFRQEAKVLQISVYNHLKVLAYDPPNSVEYINESPQLAYTLRYEFASVENGTCFTLYAELELKGVLAIVQPLTLWSLKRQLNQYFAVLKEYLEQQCE